MTAETHISRKGQTPRIGLALGAGAARGWAHIGVLRALREIGIEPEIVVGTSIGAVVGGCYVANKLDELEDFARGLSLSRLLSCLDMSFTGSGLISGQKIKRELKKHIKSQNIEQLDRRFAAVATELGSGAEVWLSEGRLVDAMHASFAIPGVFKPAAFEGRWFMDGACVNPVPVSLCKALGADHVIAVSLTPPSGHSRQPPAHSDNRGAYPGAVSDLPPVADLDGPLPGETRSERAPEQAHERKQEQAGKGIPGVFNVMQEAINATLVSLTQTRLAHDAPDAIIAPDVADIGMFDFHRADEAINAGYEMTRQQIPFMDREDLRQGALRLAA